MCGHWAQLRHFNYRMQLLTLDHVPAGTNHAIIFIAPPPSTLADRAQSVVASGAGPAADEWPEGCLGYAVNLLRPAVPGHRAALFYSQLGRTLLFETLDQAAAYRAYVLQVR